jgi:hypothetical protein
MSEPLWPRVPVDLLTDTELDSLLAEMDTVNRQELVAERRHRDALFDTTVGRMLQWSALILAVILGNSVIRSGHAAVDEVLYAALLVVLIVGALLTCLRFSALARASGSWSLARWIVRQVSKHTARSAAAPTADDATIIDDGSGQGRERDPELEG